MSSGISYRQQAYEAMHRGKRNGLSLESLLRELHPDQVKSIIKEKYEKYRPKLSHSERFSAGQTWNYKTRRWMKPDV